MKNGQLAWITKGREIENYIPEEALEKLIGSKLKNGIGQYNDVFDALENEKSGFGKKYQRKKPLLAEQICLFLTKDNIGGVLDIKERMDTLCQEIEKWN